MSAVGPSRLFAATQYFGRFRREADIDGRAALTSTDAIDPNVWSGRAVQEVFVDPADAVLHQCIRPLIGALCSGLIMDISAPAFSLPDRPQRTIWVTRFRVRREDRTSISFSSSRRPWRVNELLANATQLEACWPRRCDCELARSMRCVRACWRARWQARCGAAASWPPRSNA
jgi:hypothetical protein